MKESNSSTSCSMYDLWFQAWSMAGRSLFYMQFIHSQADFGVQKERISSMCYNLAREWRNHYKDTPENREWFNKWIEDFENETENQC